MSNNHYSFNYANSNRNTAATYFQTANPYAALIATAGPEHDRRSSSSGSPPSSGSSASLIVYNNVAAPPETPVRSQAQIHSGSRMHQQDISYGSPVQARHTGLSTNKASTCNGGTYHGSNHTGRRTSISLAHHAPIASHYSQGLQAFSLSGVPESVAVQEMAFRQGQRNSSSAFDDVPANPFAKFDQLWAAFYKLGKEYGGQPTTLPFNPSRQNFAWPVLINPYTQSLEHPNGSLDPAWTGRMIQVALNCMEELIRVTCRRNNGWDKIVADIPLPAQEALVAFPDLAHRYEQLKHDAKEARAGGRPYGY